VSSLTSIEWTEVTWNPVTGCTKVSSGCKHCYAERLARRLKAMGVARYRNGFRVTLHPDLLQAPRYWRTPRLVFVNSMSDLFHEDVPEHFIQQVFRVMDECPQHTFQILTKRAERLSEMAARLPWPENIWMGVSVENSGVLHRVADLRSVPAHVRFLSCEPLLGPIPDLELGGIHWVIVGGESGPGARPMLGEWVRDIRDQCRRNGVPFFFKQWGGTRRKKAGRLLDGSVCEEYPVRARPRVAALKRQPALPVESMGPERGGPGSVAA